MIRNATLELSVGTFLLFGIVAFVFLALQVSGLTNLTGGKGYHITARFNNVGDLKIRAPVRIAGVSVGEISDIKLDNVTFQGAVTMIINPTVKLPGGTSASIFTQGLLGSNYISLTPGFEEAHTLKDGDQIVDTNSALILENLIGQFMFSVSNKAK